MSESYFKQKTKGNYFTPLYNTTIAAHIFLYKYIAEMYLNNDLKKVVYAPSDLVLRRRQEQVQRLIQQGELDTNVGMLDLPFVGFRMGSGGMTDDDPRGWTNQPLKAKGVWIEELGRHIRIAPVTYSYDCTFFVKNDNDFQHLTQALLWDKIDDDTLKAPMELIDKNGNPFILNNTIYIDNPSVDVHNEFFENDWLEKNRIQTIGTTWELNTWVWGDDYLAKNNKWCLTKNVILDFIDKAKLPTEVGTVVKDPMSVIYDTFTVKGPYGNN